MMQDLTQQDLTQKVEQLLLGGQLAQARQLCRQAQKQHPRQAQPHYLMGVVCMQEANPQQAQYHFMQALKRDSDLVEAHYSLAIAAQALGRVLEAISHLERALRLTPEDPELHRLYGELSIAAGHTERGEASLRRAIDLESTTALTDRATHAIQPLPAIPPDQRHLLARCRTLLAERQTGQAEELARSLLAIAPTWAEGHATLGDCLFEQGRLLEAEAAYRNAVALAENQPAAYHLRLGAMLTQGGKQAEAARCFRRALALEPGTALAQSYLGLVLGRQGLMTEGEALCRQAMTAMPDDVTCLVHAAQLTSGRGGYVEARELLERAIKLQPQNMRAHLNLAILLLKQGDFERGWAEYEWRDRARRSGGATSRPLWDGALALDRTLLVHAEQGLGDTIQFVRLLPQVKTLCGHVVLEAPPALHALLNGIAGCDALVAPPEVGRAIEVQHDLEVDLMSLPARLGLRPETIPTAPYLAIPAAQSIHWRQRLENQSGAANAVLRVGLAWAGNRMHAGDRLRSLSLAELAPLATVPGVHYYSLQKGDAATQAQDPPAGMPLTDLCMELNDLADTAAAIANLDLVISVDTSVAHLAGALGCPVWTLLPYDPDWRWLLEREDSPWYPTMRLFRQKRLGDWRDVTNRVCAALKVW